MKFFSLALLINVLALSSVAAQDTRSLIVMFGDSITVGFNSGRRVDFGNGSTTLGGPRQFLSNILNNEEAPRPKVIRPSVVVNWGVGGSSSLLGSQRLSGTVALTQADYPDHRCFVLIMYGTNDFGRGIGLSTTAFNTREMIRKTRGRGCIPIVSNLTPRSDRDLGPLSDAIGSVAATENAIVVNHFSVFSRQPLSSLLELETSFITGQLIRLHPNDTGYQLLVQTWFDQTLSKLITPRELPLVITPVYGLLLDDE